LWPLNLVINRMRGETPHPLRVRVRSGRLDVLGEITRILAVNRVEIGEINTQRLGKGHYEIELQLRRPPNVSQHEIVQLIDAVDDVEILETDARTE
jgi:(p)ppGpp synthase/HD superfamily hydrolase